MWRFWPSLANEKRPHTPDLPGHAAVMQVHNQARGDRAVSSFPRLRARAPGTEECEQIAEADGLVSIEICRTSGTRAPRTKQ